MRELTPEALDEWRANPVTEFLLGVMKAEAELVMANLKEGYFWNDPDEREGMDRRADKVKAMLWFIQQVEEKPADEWSELRDELEQ